jgi:hypothetical protein
MDEPRNVPFGELGWTDDAPGIRAREAQVGGKRWATVEYGEGACREEGAKKATAGTSSRARSSTSLMTAANP